jgi:hypothetical protein
MNIIPGSTSSALNKTFTRTSYGQWFNGTNLNYGLPNGLAGKLVTTGPFIDYGIDAITFNLTKVYKNNVLLFEGYTEKNYADSASTYSFRDDGYGLGVVTYIDILNSVLDEYGIKSRFFPAGGNKLVGLINSKENFEIQFQEYATTIDEATDYWIKVESYAFDPSFTGPAGVFDTIFGTWNDKVNWLGAI